MKTKEFSLLRRVINRCDILSQSMNREQGSTSYFFTSWKFLQPSHVRRSIALNTEPKSKLFTSNKTERTSTRWHLSRPLPNDRKSNVIWIESTDTQETGPDLSGIRPVQVRETLRWSSYWGGKRWEHDRKRKLCNNTMNPGPAIWVMPTLAHSRRRSKAYLRTPLDEKATERRRKALKISADRAQRGLRGSSCQASLLDVSTYQTHLTISVTIFLVAVDGMCGGTNGRYLFYQFLFLENNNISSS